MNLCLLSGTFAICRLAPDQPIPSWAVGEVVSITRTIDELSIVCDNDQVSAQLAAERGWRCFRVAGTLDLSEIDVLASLAEPLAAAGVSIVVISTYDTDYLLVKDSRLPHAIEAMRKAGPIPLPTSDPGLLG